MKYYRKFFKKAVALGAGDARIIKTDTIVTGPRVRWKCRYGCDGYNSSLCCPPNTPDYRETRELVDSYENALPAHFTGKPGSNTDPTDVVVTLERDIFLAGHYKAFAPCSGPCQLCSECSTEVHRALYSPIIICS